MNCPSDSALDGGRAPFHGAAHTRSHAGKWIKHSAGSDVHLSAILDMHAAKPIGAGSGNVIDDIGGIKVGYPERGRRFARQIGGFVIAGVWPLVIYFR